MRYINYNNRILPASQGVLDAGNSSFRFGEGLFETMRIFENSVLLFDLHMQRLFAGLQALDISTTFTADNLMDDILELCRRNDHSESARVRLTVFRNGFLIESSHLDKKYSVDDRLVTDVYPHAKKSRDTFANLKTCSYLPYAMAAQYAKREGLDDCFVLNDAGNICDSSIANIFWISNGIIYTPPLSEGCIAGVMRKYIIENIHHAKLKLIESPLSIDTLESADEVFLTNAIRGVRPVEQFQAKSYKHEFTLRVFNSIVASLLKS